MKQSNNVWINLVGPSSAGKTDIAFALAEQLDGEVINADKFYLYSGFPSTTGMPDFSKHPNVPTRLYGILSPEMECPNEEHFAELATEAVTQCWSHGKIPIIEGCYYSFARATLQSIGSQSCVFAGIKWPQGTNVEEHVSNRVDNIFHARGGIDEVREALRKGYRNTYVMQKGSMVAPLVQYLDGTISLDAAKEKAIVEILASAYKAYRKFLDFPGITWYENDVAKFPLVLDLLASRVLALAKKASNR